MSAARFLVSSASPLRPAVEHILHLAKIPTEHVDATTASFGVCLTQGSAPIIGVAPVLRALSQEGAAPHEFFAGAPGAENQALFSQWVTTAAQLAIRSVDIETVEAVVGSTPSFLAATSDATAADVLLYSAVINDVSADSRKLPQLASWCNFVSASSFVQPIKQQSSSSPQGVAASTAAASTQAKPSAEEIERRRIEKEKAKTDKAAAAAAAQKSGGEGAASVVPSAPQKAAASAAKATPSADVDSTQLDVRVGHITSISKHPDAEKLFVESIDLGNGEVRTIVSGLVDHYKAEELQGSLCLVVCNMKPKALKGVTSQGMVLCASTESPAALELVRPVAGTAPGTRVAFAGRLSATLPPIPSNTVIVELLAHLKTDESGAVSWKDQPASVGSAPVTTGLAKAVVK